MTPMAEKTRNVPLAPQQEKWYAQACDRLNPERLKKLLVDLIDIHSPTGGERRASEFIVGYLREHLDGHALYQSINEDTGNAVGEIRGNGGGATLLLSRARRNAPALPADRHPHRSRSGQGSAVGRPNPARRHAAQGFRGRRHGSWPWRRQSKGYGRDPDRSSDRSV